MENNGDKMGQPRAGEPLGVRAQGAQDTHGTAAGGEALIDPWQRLAEHLSPLIGESGFCALYGRAIRLAVPHFDWLQAARPGKNAEQSFLALTGLYGTVHVDAASAANTVLLTTFTGLLSNLIGQALTGRLLDSAWNGGRERTHAQEQKQ